MDAHGRDNFAIRNDGDRRPTKLTPEDGEQCDSVSRMMGVSFDTFHSYNPALVRFVAALLLSSLIISRLGAYLFPVEHPIAPAESRSLSQESVT